MPAGLSAPGLTIKLAKVYEVSGRVDMAFFGDKQPSWIWIRCYPQTAGGRPMGASVNRKDGKFKIEGLKAGTYEIEAWHERLKTRTATVTVTADEAKTVDFSFAIPTKKK